MYLAVLLHESSERNNKYMNRYVGRHQSGADKGQTSQELPDNMDEYGSGYTWAREEVSATAGRTATGTVVLEQTRVDDRKGAQELSSNAVTGENENSIETPIEDWEPVPKRKRQLSKFSRFLIIYSAVFLVFIAVGLGFFWKYIAAYELSRPDNEMEVLTLDNASSTDLLKAAFSVSEFENKDKVFEEISGEYLQGQDYTFRKMPGEYSDDTPTYIFRSGTTDLFEIDLTPRSGETAGFGFQLWEVSAVTLLEGNTRTLTIEAPDDTSVSVNGIALADSYITDNHVEYEDLSEQEERFNVDVDAYRVLYTINGIYDEATVTATDAKGTELTAEKADGSNFVYDATRYSAKVTGPSDAVITINGVELSDADTVAAIFPTELFSGLEKYATAVPNLVTYEVEGLFTEPKITAKDASGKELTINESADGGIAVGFSKSDELNQSQTQLVTDLVKAYVSFSTNEGETATSNFSRLSKYLLTNTDTYKRTKNAIEGMSWVTGGTIEYRELTVADFLSCGDNCFVCRVSLGITVKADGKVRNTDSVYTIVFVRSGGNWLVGNMIAS